MKRIVLLAIPAFLLVGCDGMDQKPTSDQTQARQQEQLAAEATAQTGMPAIKNFRERKMLKDILELRDQNAVITYTYVVSEMTGKLRYFGQTIGYGIPYATQYTNPQKIAEKNTYQSGSYAILPQADPNGLFSPAAADGTWVLMQDPNSDKVVLPVYVEPRIIVSPFKLPDSILAKD